MMARSEISIFRGSLPFHAINWGYDVRYAFVSQGCVLLSVKIRIQLLNPPTFYSISISGVKPIESLGLFSEEIHLGILVFF